MTGCYRESFTSALGRQHSVMNGRFREAKLQRRLYGDELGEGKFASRPIAGIRERRLAGSQYRWCVSGSNV